jgi:hypothetical protein
LRKFFACLVEGLTDEERQVLERASKRLSTEPRS